MHTPFTMISVIVVGSALLAWVACRSRQPVILGYFLCGILIGPVGLRVISDVELLGHVSRIGVTLLLFLAGLVLHPDRLRTFARTALWVTLGSCILTWCMVLVFLRAWGVTWGECNVGALALMFSSTILVVKLLPTTTLHQKHMGSICIAVLIAQDLLAIVVLMFVGPGPEGRLALLVGLPFKVLLLIGGAVVGEQFVLRKMMWRVDRYNEVLVMLCLAWCLGMAALAEYIGVSYEVGAFVAGVAMARGKIALVLSEQLKPLRDFFLMFFFFVLGAGFDPRALSSIWVPALLLAGLILVARPLWLRWLFLLSGESADFSAETGLRLGQASEFSLIIAIAAVENGRLGPTVSQLIQLTTIVTMVVSSYIVVLRLPTPIGVQPSLKRD